MAVSRLKHRASRREAAPAHTNGSTPQQQRFEGAARLGPRTKRFVKRLGPEDIAIIDHAEIDRVSGEDLVATGVRCVVAVTE